MARRAGALWKFAGLVGACAFAIALAATAAHAQTLDQEATGAFGTLEFRSGSEMQSANLAAGGPVDASTLDPSCLGSIATQPDFSLDYEGGGTVPLTIAVVADGDTTLVVRGPDGAWHCDDDRGEGLDPRLVIAGPQNGRYQIWVGIYAAGSNQTATLLVGERFGADGSVRPRPPPGPASVSSLPAFPRWPPPRPSARQGLSRDRFVGDETFGAVADRLSRALESAGNARASFYSAPGGFALVARLERIRDDARPATGADRFIAPPAGQPEKPDDPLDFVEALFFAPAGYYRQVVFVVSDQTFGESAWTLSTEEAAALLREGGADLTSEYRARAFTAGHRVTALIYEFRKQGSAEAQVRLPGQWNADTHLLRSGLLTYLPRNN